MRRLFSSESVTEGHPDKLCDRISDSILDEYLKQDPMARVACETFTTTGMVVVMGEITSTARVDIPGVVRRTLREVGYTKGEYGIDANSCSVMTSIDGQSPDINGGVSDSLEKREGSEDRFEAIGAGDQGMMFGYASDDTPELMPLPISLSHALVRKADELRHAGAVKWLRPDGKSLVTVEYENDRPLRVEAVVMSVQHDPEVTIDEIRAFLMENVIKAVIPAKYLDENTKFYINPSGRFVTGGPQGDTGLTGRKIIVDTYGGFGRHGGGAFSGKDCTKVDRTGAYAARYIAKNLVAAGLCRRCEVEIAYAIGKARPVSVMVDTFGTGKVDDEKLTALACSSFDLRPAALIEQFGLRRPIFAKTSDYGHFGRTDVSFPWEETDMAAQLKDAYK